MLRRDEVWALTATAILAIITASWWMFALWPAPALGAAWLERLQSVCFGVTGSGLPDTSGWVVLILQPALMFGILFAAWGGSVRSGIIQLANRPAGRVGLAVTAFVLVGFIGAGSARVARAAAVSSVDFVAPDEIPPETYPRLDRTAPPLELVNQFGDSVRLEQFRGRPVLITFAFGHCTTICPVVVRDVRMVRERVDEPKPVVLIVSLDPWRDVPTRLPHIAERWGLAREEFVVSGAVDGVEDVLDAWNVARARDGQTGDITHPRLVYIVDERGLVVYATTGGVETIMELVRRL